MNDLGDLLDGLTHRILLLASRVDDLERQESAGWGVRGIGMRVSQTGTNDPGVQVLWSRGLSVANAQRTGTGTYEIVFAEHISELDAQVFCTPPPYTCPQIGAALLSDTSSPPASSPSLPYPLKVVFETRYPTTGGKVDGLLSATPANFAVYLYD